MWKDLAYRFRQGGIIIQLIFIMIAVFLCFEIPHLVLWAMRREDIYYEVYRWFALPGSFAELVQKPWTAITFMFMHADVWHILYNLLWLYWFGEIYQLYMHQKRVLPLFIFGSLAGGLLFMLSGFLLPVSGYLVGASAGIFAIMFAATALNPEHDVNMLFVGRVALKYVALVALLISVLTIHLNPGGVISHVGGSLFGYLYIISLRNGVDWFTPLDKIAGIFKRGSKLKATHVRGKEAAAEKKDLTSSEQKRLDQILDKISRSGYNSLSKEEKDFLFKYSNK